MKHALHLEIQPQPDDSSCGPTCLAAVYAYWNDPVEIGQLIRETGGGNGSGTLAVQLGCHALGRGYDTEITTYNLHLFDPSWFDPISGSADADRLSRKLNRQLQAKRDRKDIDVKRFEVATGYYLQYLRLGGRVRMQRLDDHLITKTLTAGVPILCGLSATYLYQESRERPQPLDADGRSSVADDIVGDPVGHFVVLHGYDRRSGNVLIADPLHPNPFAPTNNYLAPLSQVTSAILLGIVTYDANLLTLEPVASSERNLN
ncbi:hypothetical protein Enr13x_26470 [Stieleria neptunia]|uniref:Peptidase C39 family protein n=1 Tax=Stieleria neptunia TaxID=2527979 RepID=A0A518HPT0_9BACT|nr:hypothetical protein [Stieleria neptunia]QDV42797.1 hypothetical protein Enr13x_26470 [Stieleria neptunia]